MKSKIVFYNKLSDLDEHGLLPVLQAFIAGMKRSDRRAALMRVDNKVVLYVLYFKGADGVNRKFEVTRRRACVSHLQTIDLMDERRSIDIHS